MKSDRRKLIILLLCCFVMLLLPQTALAETPDDDGLIHGSIAFEGELYPDISAAAPPALKSMTRGYDPCSYENVKQTIVDTLRYAPFDDYYRTVQFSYTGDMESFFQWINGTVYQAYLNAVLDYNDLLFFAGSGVFNVDYWGEDNDWTLVFKPELDEELVNVYAAEVYQNALELACAQAFGTTDPANSGMTELELVACAHDWIASRVVYNPVIANRTDNEAGSWTSEYGDTFTYSLHQFGSYGVFVERDAVCEGYAAAFTVLMNRAGVSSCVVHCNEIQHSWNLVQVGGQWYQIDCTWDDPIYLDGVGDYAGHIGRGNFLRSDAVFCDNHADSIYWDTEYDYSCPSDYLLPDALKNAAETPVFRAGGTLGVLQINGGEYSLRFSEIGTDFGTEFLTVSVPELPLTALFDYEHNDLYMGAWQNIYRMNINGCVFEQIGSFPQAGMGNGIVLHPYGDGILGLDLIYGYHLLDSIFAGYSEKYTATFVLNGGEGETSRQICYGAVVEFPEVKRKGYRFTGWYYDEGLNYPVRPMVLMNWGPAFYAGWEETDVELSVSYIDSSIVCTLMYPEEDSYTVIAAYYGADGKMIISLKRTISDQQTFPHLSGRECRLFLLNEGTLQPAAEAVIIPVNN